MTGGLSSFVDLLAPVRQEIFFEQHWESQPLHIQRSGSDYYTQLLTNRDVEAVISSGGLRYPAIQLARDGGFFPPEAFTRNVRSGDDIFTGIPDLDRIRAEYQSGATISLPGFRPQPAFASFEGAAAMELRPFSTLRKIPAAARRRVRVLVPVQRR
jgi:hypothetical protein